MYICGADKAIFGKTYKIAPSCFNKCLTNEIGIFGTIELEKCSLQAFFFI